MTKKDYILLARVLNEDKSRLETDANISANTQAAALTELSIITGKIAYTLQQDNPRFNRAKFLQACGYTE